MSAPESAEPPLACGIVAIGRNEGERLKRCLMSARQAAMLVYVDSGSSDGSVAWARAQGIDVVELDTSAGFTAARARNAGFRRLKQLAPELQLVQFVDGDCELAEGWLGAAIDFLAREPQATAVFGRLRERFPDRSIYNRLCDEEWGGPAGQVKYCGGNAMMRASALDKAGGYRDDLIAGEEPELCVRLRRDGGTVWRIGHAMGFHDANILHFSQWWRRRKRSGYAFGEGSHIHGRPPENHWVWESRRAWLWGIWLPLACVLAVIAFGAAGLLLLLIYPLQLLRRIPRQPGDLPTRIQFAALELLGRFAEGAGQLRFTADRLLRSRGRIIDYK
ncbi:GT2 family glycosyltransferase [Bradyrhizobium sp. USDA 4463]